MPVNAPPRVAVKPRSSLPAWLLCISLGLVDPVRAEPPVVLRVLDATSGKPVENAWVTLENGAATEHAPTNEQGEAPFGATLAGPRTRVRVSRPDDYVDFDRTVVVSRGLNEVSVKPNRDLRKDLSVQGRVVGRDGLPFPNVTPEVSIFCGLTQATASLENDGSFVAKKLAPGPCRASAAGWTEQFFTLTASTPPLEFGPRVDDVVVTVDVPGATSVKIVKGDTYKEPRSCHLYCNCTGGVSDWIPAGLDCLPSGKGRFVCPPVSKGLHTVTAFHTTRSSVIERVFDQWSRVITVGKKPVSVTLPAFRLPGAAEGPARADGVLDGVGGARRIHAIHAGCDWP